MSCLDWGREMDSMFTPFYTLYGLIVVIAIVVWIVIRRLQ